ncbi:MAG: TrmB family transcriptional regulator [Candidatus Thorarchaeota archaeon]|nr:TrmB family transcriptional regulator [Candidatus Thorarchaeota archaeon]
MTLSSEKSAEEVGARASSTLREIGFGAHETSVILALNQIESATVADLSSETGIHHANLYSVLESLIGRGLVVLHSGRPKVYQFAPLSHVKEMFSSKMEQLLEDLKILQDSRDSKGIIPALIYTIRGSADVLAKMVAMIGRAKQSIFLVAPDLDELSIPIHESLRKAKSRGVIIQGIFGQRPNTSDIEIQYRIKEDTLAIDLVIDSIEALISMPDLTVCGWADNALISMQLEGFLQQSWKLSRKE